MIDDNDMNNNVIMIIMVVIKCTAYNDNSHSQCLIKRAERRLGSNDYRPSLKA